MATLQSKRRIRRWSLWVPLFLALAMFLHAQAPPSEVKPCTKEWMDSVVFAVYLHGFPEEEFIKFCTITPEVDHDLQLISTLDEHVGAWQNAILLQGVLGNESAVPFLERYLHQNKIGRLPIGEYRAKLAVLHSLGLILAQTHDNNARIAIKHYLQAGTRPGTWNQRRPLIWPNGTRLETMPLEAITWQTPYENDDVYDRNRELSKAAIDALALSGQANLYLTDIQTFLGNVRFDANDHPTLPTGPQLPELSMNFNLAAWVPEDLNPESTEILKQAAAEGYYIGQTVSQRGIRHYFAKAH